MRHDNEQGRPAFLLTASQMTNIFCALPADTKIFESRNDDLRFIGKRNQFLDTLSHLDQVEDVPQWSVNGTLVVLDKMQFVSADSICDGCSMYPSEFSVLLCFRDSLGPAGTAPRLETIPLSEMLTRNLPDLGSGTVQSLEVKKYMRIMATLAAAVVLSKESKEIGFDMENGYYFGNQWWKGATADSWNSLICLMERDLPNASQVHEANGGEADEGEDSSEEYTDSIVPLAAVRVLEEENANTIWDFIGVDETPSFFWTFGFWVGVTQGIEALEALEALG